MNWSVPDKPAELTENRLVAAFLDGTFPVDSNLPAERELALQLGVTRPTLREALQRLARDGWIEIRQGKPTRVRNYWQEGNLAVLAAIARRRQDLPANFVPDLLSVRILLAPAYARLAIERTPGCIVNLLEVFPIREKHPEGFLRLRLAVAPPAYHLLGESSFYSHPQRVPGSLHRDGGFVFFHSGDPCQLVEFLRQLA